MTNPGAFAKSLALCFAVAAFHSRGAAAMGGASVSWSADSKVVAVSAGPRSVELYDAAGKLLWRKSFESLVTGFAMSPDGGRLAYVLPSEGIRLVTLASSRDELAHPMPSGSLCTALQWSPDGAKLFASMMYMDPETKALNPAQRPRMFLLAADGSRATELRP